MKLERIGVSAPAESANPGVLVSRDEPGGITTKALERQRQAERGIIPPMPSPEAGSLTDWKAKLVCDGYFLAVEIVEPKGPIACIGSPLVCVGYGDGWTSVWVCKDRWQFPGDPFRFWLTHGSKAAVVHAIKLRDALGRAATAEQARRDRAKAAYRFGGAE